jgi:hypothetical protein
VADDVGRLVGDDPAVVLVPQDRDRDAAVVAVDGRLVGLLEELEAVDAVAEAAA